MDFLFKAFQSMSEATQGLLKSSASMGLATQGLLNLSASLFLEGVEGLTRLMWDAVAFLKWSTFTLPMDSV